MRFFQPNSSKTLPQVREAKSQRFVKTERSYYQAIPMALQIFILLKSS